MLGYDRDTPAEGYERVEEWAGELILQRLKPKDVRLEGEGLENVRAHRLTVSTYFPALFQPGQLGGDVFWDPVSQGDRSPRPPERLKGEIATRKSVGAFGILSGLGVSTDMPVTEEKFGISAVIDLGTDPKMKELSKKNQQLDAVIWKEESPDDWKVVGAVGLRSGRTTRTNRTWPAIGVATNSSKARRDIIRSHCSRVMSLCLRSSRTSRGPSLPRS